MHICYYCYYCCYYSSENCNNFKKCLTILRNIKKRVGGKSRKMTCGSGSYAVSHSLRKRELRSISFPCGSGSDAAMLKLIPQSCHSLRAICFLSTALICVNNKQNNLYKQCFMKMFFAFSDF